MDVLVRMCNTCVCVRVCVRVSTCMNASSNKAAPDHECSKTETCDYLVTYYCYCTCTIEVI